MRFTLSSGDLQEFRRNFFEGVSVSGVVDDPEMMRFWHVLFKDSGRVILQHGTGAVAILLISGGKISAVELFQGDSAEPFLREYGFRVSVEARNRAGKALGTGVSAAEVLSGMHWLSPLPPVDMTLRYRLSWGGVLLVRTDEAGRVISHGWLEGGEALDLLLEVL